MTATQLKRARAALGLSQSQLAEKLGIHRSAIAKYEGGELEIPLMLVLALNWLDVEAKIPPNANRSKSPMGAARKP
jgi:transcriptional regulator with XRE-family HTH domain